MEVAKRKTIGKHGNKVRLNTLVYAWQLEELDRIGQVTGHSMADMVSQALVIYIGELKKAGV